MEDFRKEISATEAGSGIKDGSTARVRLVSEVLSLPQLRGFSEDDVRHVVETNDKQRFTLEEHPENGRLRIRANQGHSMQVGAK